MKEKNDATAILAGLVAGVISTLIGLNAYHFKFKKGFEDKLNSCSLSSKGQLESLNIQKTTIINYQKALGIIPMDGYCHPVLYWGSYPATNDGKCDPKRIVK